MRNGEKHPQNVRGHEAPKTARAAIRVSLIGNKDEDAQYSAKLQMEDSRRYCALLNFDFDEVNSMEHADLDVSGFRKPWRKRPGMWEHFKAAERGEFTELIFYKISRLGRNVRESLDLIESFENLGVTIHFVQERLDTSTAHGRMIRTIMLAVAEQQSEDTSAFIKDASFQRAKDGKIQGGGLPIWISRGDGGLKLLEDQVQAMRRLVELRMAGLGYVKIAKQLNVEGFRTRRGACWTEGMVFKYLTSSWISTMEGTGFFNRDLPTGDPRRVVIPDAFPPILTSDEASALHLVQLRYHNAPRPSPIKGGGDWQTNLKRDGRWSASSSHLLSSIVFCQCGTRLLSINHGRDKGTYSTAYQCGSARTNPIAHPGGTSVDGAGLEDAVLRVVRKVLSEPPPPAPKRVPKRKAGKTLANINDDIDWTIEAYRHHRLTAEDYERQYLLLISEREKLIRAEADDTAPAAFEQAQALLVANSGIPNREELRQLILLLIQRVEAPYVIEGVTVRSDLKSLRRHARVTLQFPTAEGVKVWLAPIHTEKFQGERLVFPEPPVEQKTMTEQLGITDGEC